MFILNLFLEEFAISDISDYAQNGCLLFGYLHFLSLDYRFIFKLTFHSAQESFSLESKVW